MFYRAFKKFKIWKWGGANFYAKFHVDLETFFLNGK